MNAAEQEIRHTTIEDELKQGKSIIYYTVGVSMKPLLKTRQTHVTIVPLGENAENGDILLYIRRNGDRVLHRLIRQEERFYYMRGDNTYGLERIEKFQAIGVVTQIYRKGVYIDVASGQWYRRYVRLWNWCYPLRCVLWRARRLAGKLKRCFWK